MPTRAKSATATTLQWIRNRLATGRARRNNRRGGKEEGSSPPQRRRRVRWIVAVVVVLAAYPVLGTLALWTGLVEKLLRSEDLRVEIENPAWTLWPGRLHLKTLEVYLNGGTQFTLSVDEVVVGVNLLSLFDRRFSVSSLSAQDVRFRMRVQVAKEDKDAPRVAAFPPLEGLPGEVTIVREDAEKTEERGGEWTVAISGIDATVSELWFLEYHYLGDGKLLGGFTRGPDVLHVETSVQELGPGELRFGDKQVIATGFGGRVQAEIPESNPKEHGTKGLFELIEADIQLEGDVKTLEHVGAYLNGPKVSGGAGPFQLKVAMNDGLIAQGSAMSYSTDKVGLQAHGVAVESDWTLAFHVGEATEAARKTSDAAQGPRGGAAGKAGAPGDVSSPQAGEGGPDGQGSAGKGLPTLTSKGRMSYLSLAKAGAPPFTIQIHDHDQRITLDSAKISDETGLQGGRFHFPKIVTKDLDDVGGLAGKGSDLSKTEGSARASLTLDMDAHGVLRGPLTAKLEKARLVFADILLGGSGSLDTSLRVDPRARSLVASDLDLALNDVVFRLGDEYVEDWWMRLSSDKLSASGMPPTSFSTDLTIVAKDAEPVIEGLAEKDQLPDIVAKLTSLDDLRIVAEVRKDGEVTDVMLRSVESLVYDFSGRVYLDKDTTLLALLIGGETVSLGIFKKGEDTSYKPFAGADWLNQKLAAFPKPRERVSGSKP